MLESIGTALPVILAMTLLSVALVAWRSEEMAKAYGGPKIAVVAGYLVGGLLLGCIAVLVYAWMAGRWPEAAPTIYLGLALGLAMWLNIMAFRERRNASRTAVMIWIILNMVWAAGYGWLVPLIHR
jgi:CHASE2 domain-containing sensor protein